MIASLPCCPSSVWPKPSPTCFGSARSCLACGWCNQDLFPFVAFDELVISYTDQLRDLLDGGIDVLMVEAILTLLMSRFVFTNVELVRFVWIYFYLFLVTSARSDQTNLCYFKLTISCGVYCHCWLLYCPVATAGSSVCH